MSLQRSLTAALLCLAAAAPLAAQRAGPADRVLVVTPDVAARDEGLARLAQRFTARLLEALEGSKVRAARVGRAELDSLRHAKSAGLALDASIGGDEGRRSVQLRLLRVATGDELRAYMFGPGDDQGVLGLADRAAPRIAAAVKEEAAGR